MAEIAEQRTRGFDWISDMNRSLADYEAHRDQSRTIDAFMPSLAKCLSDYAARLPDADE